jgi:hypothetical protein
MQGFVNIRRGILRHLRTGSLRGDEFAALMAMILMAEPATGMWWDSPGLLAMLFARRMSERAARRALNGLVRKGYIRRFKRPGRRGDQPILIHGYEVAEGPRFGMRLNARATTRWGEPVYGDVEDLDTLTSAGTDPTSQGERSVEQGKDLTGVRP